MHFLLHNGCNILKAPVVLSHSSGQFWQPHAPLVPCIGHVSRNGGIVNAVVSCHMFDSFREVASFFSDGGGECFALVSSSLKLRESLPTSTGIDEEQLRDAKHSLVPGEGQNNLILKV